MPTTPATADTTACRQAPVARAVWKPPTVRIWVKMSSRQRGMTTMVMTLRMVLMPSFRSEWTFL